MSNRILPIFALFVAAMIFFGYVRQAWIGDISSIKAEIAKDDEALAAAAEYKAQQNELASARNAIDEESLGKLTTLLPDSVDNVGLILNLNALAARNGISLSNINVATNAQESVNPVIDPTTRNAGMETANPVSSVDISLSAIGSYASLQNFLHGLEKSLRLLDVREIKIRGSDTGVYNYNMILRIYWLR